MTNKFPSYTDIFDYCFDNFRLAYSVEKKEFEKLKEFIPLKTDSYSYYFENLTELTPSFFNWKSWEFPIFIDHDITEYRQDGKLNFDIFLNIFLLLSGWQEWQEVRTDEHERFPYIESLQSRFNFVTTPVVSIYFELLYEMCKEHNLSISRIQFDSPLIFTHDIDQLRSGWFEDIKYELSNFKPLSLFSISKSLFIKLFGGKDSYYRSFETMMNIEQKNEISSLSFVLPKKSHSDADYNLEIEKFKKLITSFSAQGEIGLHPGYTTFNNTQEFESQKSKLEKITGKKIDKSRQHFLKFDVKQTPRILETLEITEDHSLGFVENYGFRNSVATPFFLYDFSSNQRFNTKEIPLVFMDSTLIDYLGDVSSEQKLRLTNLIDRVSRDFNCNLSILFHNTAFSEKRYTGFTDLYLRLIEISKKSIETS